MIWRLAGTHTWEGVDGPWLGPFLDALHQSSTDMAGRLAYFAYQIWLSRNALVFEAKVIPVYWMVQRATSMAKEYHRFDTTIPSIDALET